MKQATRTRLYRLAFGLTCVLPTLCIAGAAVIRNSSSYQAALTSSWQDRLASQLGLEVHLDSVDAQLGTSPVLRGVELRDPESHAWLVRAHSVTILSLPRGLALVVGPTEVQQSGLPRLAALLHEHVLVRAGSEQPAVQWHAEAATLRNGQLAESLLDVNGKLESRVEGAELVCFFRATTMPKGQSVQVRWVRNRQINPPATGWEVHVPAAGVPCAVAVGWIPGLAALGTDCMFTGSVWSEQREGGWETELNGQFRQLDLEQLVTRQFRHKLSGVATATVNQIRVRDGRVVVAEGRLQCPGGVVGKSLLDTATRVWNVGCDPRVSEAQYLTYNQLSLDFSLQAAGLRLGAPSAVVMSDAEGPLVTLRDESPRSPTSVVQLLVPPATLQVPVTRETASLIDVLPLPEQAPLPIANGYPVLRFSLR